LATATDKQVQLTQTSIDVEIAGNRGEAQLAEARRLAERDVVLADGDARAKELIGKGEASRIGQTGAAEARVFLQKIEAYRDPRLFALDLVAAKLASSQQPLVPERVMMTGASNGGGESQASNLGPLGTLIAVLLADKSGFGLESHEVSPQAQDSHVEPHVESEPRPNAWQPRAGQ
jgi:uncharacterized membrane protein YqiK